MVDLQMVEGDRNKAIRVFFRSPKTTFGDRISPAPSKPKRIICSKTY